MARSATWEQGDRARRHDGAPPKCNRPAAHDRRNLLWARPTRGSMHHLACGKPCA